MSSPKVVRIVFCCTGTRAEPWISAFEAALPGVSVSPWVPGAHAAEAADYAVVWAPPQEFFDGQPGLRCIFNIGAGVDALAPMRLPPGVPVVRLDDAGMSVQMAEYVCHAVIRHFRELDAIDADMSEGKWAYRKPRLRSDFPVGIMGMGTLGTRVAQSLLGFEFPVNGWSRTPHSDKGMRCFSGPDGLAPFLAASRVLVCLLPLTAQTENLLNKTLMAQLQPAGYVINVARGAHLVDDDLIELLDAGVLAGATLDVFRQEPLAADHPFWAHPKITLTPHMSARTLRNETVAQIAGKIAALEQGAALAHIAGVVDFNRGY